jgi:hypothetical protein
VATERETLRQLNHIEMVYRPGERALAVRVFEFGMCVVGLLTLGQLVELHWHLPRRASSAVPA